MFNFDHLIYFFSFYQEENKFGVCWFLDMLKAVFPPGIKIQMILIISGGPYTPKMHLGLDGWLDMRQGKGKASWTIV